MRRGFQRPSLSSVAGGGRKGLRARRSRTSRRHGRSATSTLDGVRAPTIDERDSQLRWLLLLRVAIASAVLLVVMYLQFLVGSADSLRPLFAVVGLVYALSIVWAVLHDRVLEWPPFAGVQLSTDVFLATSLIYFMGGVRSAFVVLYLVIVAAAGLMLTRRGAIYIAGLTVVCYGLVGLSVYASVPLIEWLPASIQRAFQLGLLGDRIEYDELYLRLFALLLVSYGMAWLSFTMSARLRRAGFMLRTRQAQLRALRKLHERIIHGMTSGLVATDAEGIVVTANGAAAEIMGCSTAKLIGRPVWRIFGDDKEFLDRLDERLSENRVYRTDRSIQSADGTWKTIGMTVARLEDDDNEGDTPKTVSVFMFRDLTDIKRMQRELRIRERMSVLGQMAGSIAHEIRNPLASISGSLQLLGRSNLRSDDPNADELIQIVVRESDRLSRIIEDFLEYAKPGRFEPEDTDLLELVNDTFTLLRNSPELHADHSLSVIAEPASYNAVVDPAQIKQVFWNLARNAVQAMPKGGALEVSLRETPKGIEVTFEDTGAGMAPEEIETFFQPSVSAQSKGAGLGLAVVYRILDRHGVRIEVDSEVGKGTRCTLTFGERTMAESEEQMVLIGGDPGLGDDGSRAPGEQ
ncbi:MAG: PAS domain S-box protein [Acidobacteria bacterium]|nr:PAS domain S-box protein [Acidobacteriota bacterium]